MVAIGSLALASCVSLETAVPPVATLAGHGGDAATLAAGRRTYLEGCTHCHSPQPVPGFSAARWPGIIAEMAPRAKLTSAQERALLAYVLAASGR
jgi:mono/diheme cytochrome c family protein